MNTTINNQLSANTKDSLLPEKFCAPLRSFICENIVKSNSPLYLKNKLLRFINNNHHTFYQQTFSSINVYSNLTAKSFSTNLALFLKNEHHHLIDEHFFDFCSLESNSFEIENFLNQNFTLFFSFEDELKPIFILFKK